MPQVSQNVILLSHTPEPEKLIATAARLCYSKTDVAGLLKEMDKKEVSKFIMMLRGRGHLSPFEHANFTFVIEGISRANSHQLVRHRIASFSQASQRFIDKTKTEIESNGKPDFNWISPQCVDQDSPSLSFVESMNKAFETYQFLRKEGWKPEDARTVLPNACETKIMVTMNARELLHFFDLRTSRHAQHEIREMANIMLKLCKEIAPNVFRCAGHKYLEDEGEEALADHVTAYVVEKYDYSSDCIILYALSDKDSGIHLITVKVQLKNKTKNHVIKIDPWGDCSEV